MRITNGNRVTRKNCTGKALAALLATVVLAGCMVGPNHQTPGMPLPARWSNTGDRKMRQPAPRLAHWWKRLNDPLLTALVERAVQGNLNVALAKARILEARATLRQETGALFPLANGTSSVNRTRSPGIAANDGAHAVSTQHQAGFDARWELDLFGGKQRAAEAARYGLDASEEDLRNTLLVLVGDVVLNYTQVRAQQALLGLARRTAQSQRQTASLIRAKYDAGSAANADMARAEAVAATTQADGATFEIDHSLAVHRLGILLGLAPAALTGELSKRAPIPRPRFPLPLGVPADILSNRPDLRMAERQLAQATARIGVAEAARYPSISLTGNITTQAMGISDLAQKSTIGWAIGPSLTLPLLRGGQLQAAVDGANARRDQALLTYQSAVLTAMGEVENAIISLTRQQDRHTKLAAAVRAYRKAANAARIQYASGASEYLNLLDSQRALYGSETALINSQLAITAAYIALNKALGGGWSGTADAAP
ncbi:efflux transporter outer membrane subunit [Phyllobacterium sp. 22229]|uniref:efflux transporter outer membrane subunit n=1 Tax=Phyllobacterium sp. 22229 TaxID=3453895 RepID=UPI003F845D3E